LRYAVFALTKTQTAAEVMQQHLSELRRRCIVTVLGPLSFRLELKGGVIADGVVHECYPEVIMI
jgi:hypothetical protein